MSKVVRSQSLAFRLSLWYGFSSFLLIASVTAFLYWVLLRNFEQQNDRYLAEKVAILRTLLQESGAKEATVKWEVEEELSAHPSIRVLSRVLGRDGNPLFETPGMSEELPERVFTHPTEPEVRSVSGRSYRVLRTELKGVNGRPSFNIQAAIDLGYQRDLLHHYRNQLWGALAVGLALSLFIGHKIATGGIKPVREMARAVQRIRSNTLDERIRLNNPPSEIVALSEAFNQTLDRLQEAFARLSQFSSDIAHELRTPVNNLRGELEVALTRARSGEAYREVIGSALEESQRVCRLIESLLFLARADQPETAVQREQLNVSDEVAKLMAFYGPAAVDQQISLRSQVPANLRANLDRNLLQRAVGNLMENAFRYTPRGGSVTVRAEPTGDRLAVTVSDTGMGIAQEHISRVFDRFYRVDAARSAEAGGAGLGLAIVKSIAKLHGGDVEIRATEGQGTSVTLYL